MLPRHRPTREGGGRSPRTAVKRYPENRSSTQQSGRHRVDRRGPAGRGDFASSSRAKLLDPGNAAAFDNNVAAAHFLRGDWSGRAKSPINAMLKSTAETGRWSGRDSNHSTLSGYLRPQRRSPGMGRSRRCAPTRRPVSDPQPARRNSGDDVAGAPANTSAAAAAYDPRAARGCERDG